VLSIRDAGTDRRTSAQSRSVPPEWKAPWALERAQGARGEGGSAIGHGPSVDRSLLNGFSS